MKVITLRTKSGMGGLKAKKMDESINDWLASNPGVTIKFINQFATGVGVFVSIFYEE